MFVLIFNHLNNLKMSFISLQFKTIIRNVLKVDDDKGIKHELLEATMRRRFSIDIFGIISLKFSMISSVSIEINL